MQDRRSLTVLALVVGGGFLVFLGVLVNQVGGMQIRSASQVVAVSMLLTDQTTLSPGLPTLFRVPAEITPPLAQVLLRLSGETVSLQRITARDLQSGAVSVTVPCSGSFLEQGENIPGRIVLAAVETGAVLAQSEEVRVLPAGPDCFFK